MPTRHTDASKLQAEEILRAWQADKPGRRLRIVRPGVVFGPGDQGNMRRLIHGLSRGRFAYIGRQDTVKSCIYIKDMVRLLVRLIDDDGPHDTYHAVYPQPTTIRDHVDAINAAWGWDRRPPTVPYRLALAAATPIGLIDPAGTRFGRSSEAHPETASRHQYQLRPTCRHRFHRAVLAFARLLLIGDRNAVVGLPP